MSDEIRMLRDSAATLVANHFSSDSVRRMTATDAGIDPAAGRAVLEQGWLGIAVPEALGGAGLGHGALGAVLEVLGRSFVPGPFWSAATLGVPALVHTANAARREQWLPDLVAGTRRVTVALQDGSGLPAPGALAAVAEPLSGGRRALRGIKRFVPDLIGADGIAVAVADPDGPTVFLIEADRPGVRLDPNPLTDGTSRLGTLSLDDVEVTAADRLGDWSLVERLLLSANVGLAALATGGFDAVFEQVVGYAKERQQFGVPIGTFQAVQHPLADLFGELESARSAYLYAAWAVDHEADDRRRAVALARLATTRAYQRATTVSLQAHGGIAFTWEYDLHLHLKRALHFGWTLGQEDDYAEIIARDGLDL
ncbi:MAG: acyl-CoA dehydrogenase family protein [Gemmatimonadetes bacterium]|nr:acyl-CoA dehydrogenase family protein [Gemmatimonadota bacterium]